MQTRFRAKTWIYWFHFIGASALGLFCIIMGAQYWTGAMKDINGEVRTRDGLVLLLLGSCLMPVAVLAAFNIVSRFQPIIRCYREGIECKLIGVTALDGIPLFPGFILLAWKIPSLQGFRSQYAKMTWPDFGGAQVSGFPMAYVLSLSGSTTNQATGEVTQGELVFAQATLIDHPEHIAGSLNELAADPSQRDQLVSWSSNPADSAPSFEPRLIMREDPAKPVYIVPTAGQRGMTPLHHAAYSNDVDAVRAELEKGVPVDVRDDGGRTPLHWSIDMAQAWGEPELVTTLLIENGASPNAVDKSGFSVLMLACGRNNESILDRLIAAGADINLRNMEATPLHEAAGCNFRQGIERLLALGANPRQTDSHGRTPEQVAEECGFAESLPVLKAAREAK